MNVLNVSSYWQSLVIGLIILAGVSFDTYRRSRSGRPLPALLARLGGGRDGATAEDRQAERSPSSPIGRQ
jgi:hypothetical protein